MKKILIQILNIPIYYLSYLVKKDNKLWIFGAWEGLSYSDNSKYLFKYVNKYHSNIRSVWITKSKKVYFEMNSNGYEVVYAYSLEGYLISLKAKVAIISNSKMGDLNAFALNKNTLLVQLWHGIPMKKLGFDSINSKRYLINNFLKFIFPWIKSNYNLFILTSIYTKKYFRSAFKIADDRISLAGYPRTDVITNKNYLNDDRLKVLYMPTYRETINEEMMLSHFFNIKKVNEFLKKFEILIDVKLHPQSKLTDYFKNNNEGNINILEVDDIYEVISKYDLLITDYSSIYYDFLLTDKPIILAPFDLANYSKTRGLYEDYLNFFSENIVFSLNDLMFSVKDILINKNDPFKNDRIKLKNLFYKYNDSLSCKRIVDEIEKKLLN